MDAFVKSAIVPIIKNKTGDINKYRPIALVTVISKIFELSIINILNKLLDTSDNQFGFKKQHSTDVCIFANKTVIQYYNNFNIHVSTLLKLLIRLMIGHCIKS